VLPGKHGPVEVLQLVCEQIEGKRQHALATSCHHQVQGAFCATMELKHLVCKPMHMETK
jgi:hypothetical protein